MPNKEKTGKYAETYFSKTRNFVHISNGYLHFLNGIGYLLVALLFVAKILMVIPKKLIGTNTAKEIEPPGPTGHFMLGIYPELAARGPTSIQFYNDLWHSYARQTGICQLRLGQKHFYLITKPEYCEQVLLNPKMFPRGRSFKTMRYFLGETALTTEGEEWKQKSREIFPHVSPKKLPSYAVIILQAGRKLCERWLHYSSSKTPLNLLEEMSLCSMEIISRSLLNMDLSVEMPSATKALDIILGHMAKNMTGILPPGLAEMLPTQANRDYALALETLRNELGKAIKKYISAKKHEQGEYYINERIAENYDDLSKGIISQTFLNEIMLIFFAGHDTTSKLLTWTLYEVSRNPQVCRELCYELNSVLQGNEVTLENLKDLTYLTKLIQESLRIYPPVSSIIRDVAQNVTMGPYTLKKDSFIILAMRLMGNDNKLWENPSIFNPNRFTNELTNKTTQFNLIPFIAGNHRCPGRFIALMEAKCIIAMLIQKFTFEISAQGEISPITRITLYPDRPILITPTERQRFCCDSRTPALRTAPSASSSLPIACAWKNKTGATNSPANEADDVLGFDEVDHCCNVLKIS